MVNEWEGPKTTFKEIDKLLNEIMFRATEIKDDEIYRNADRCTALIRILVTKIEMESHAARST